MGVSTCKTGVVRHVIMAAVREKGTQTNVADEAGIDGPTLSRFLSGEASLKIDAIEKIFNMANARLVSEIEYQETEAILKGLARRALGL